MTPILSVDLGAWVLRVGLIAALCLASWVGGCCKERMRWEVQAASAEALADTKVSTLEDALKFKEDTHAQVLDFVAAVHQRDLDSLRNRPTRRVEVVQGGACAGVTGAELSRPDAGFLTGEAARAQRILSERDEIAGKFNDLLKACDSSVSSVVPPQEP